MENYELENYDFVEKKVSDRERCDYLSATLDYMKRGVESVKGKIEIQDAIYDCGMDGEEVKKFTIEITMKDKSLFQPHSGSLEEFTNEAFISFVEGELNRYVGLRIENPEA